MASERVSGTYNKWLRPVRAPLTLVAATLLVAGCVDKQQDRPHLGRRVDPTEATVEASSSTLYILDCYPAGAGTAPLEPTAHPFSLGSAGRVEFAVAPPSSPAERPRGLAVVYEPEGQGFTVWKTDDLEDGTLRGQLAEDGNKTAAEIDEEGVEYMRATAAGDVHLRLYRAGDAIQAEAHCVSSADELAFENSSV